MTVVTFEATPATLERIPPMVEVVRGMATDMADQLIDAGLPVNQAGSVVANILLQEAWIVAAVSKMAVGGVPDPAVFTSSVEEMLALVRFDRDERERG